MRKLHLLHVPKTILWEVSPVMDFRFTGGHTACRPEDQCCRLTSMVQQSAACQTSELAPHKLRVHLLFAPLGARWKKLQQKTSFIIQKLPRCQPYCAV